MIEMPLEFADAVCNMRMNSLSNAVMHDETNRDLRNLEKWHVGNRYRQTPGWACRECKQRATDIWNEFQKLVKLS